MTTNLIKTQRLRLGLTQKQLAAEVGTSQQQIQRMEAGVQTVRLDLAVCLCKALRSPLETIFPSSTKAFSSFKKKSGEEAAYDHEQMSEEFANAGIDFDVRVWRLRYTLRNGVSGSHVISGPEKERLWGALQSPSDEKLFVVFDNPTYRLALNLKQLVFWQFLFDPPSINVPERRSDEILVYLSCQSDPVKFDVEPDAKSMDEDIEDDEDVQLQNLLFSLDVGCEADDVVCFTDVDGESVFLRAREIAMICVPLWTVEPALFEAKIDGYKESGEEDDDTDVREET